MRGIGFIAMLFCMGAAALLVGGMNLYEVAIFRFDGASALMQLAHPEKKVTLTEGGYDVHFLDVKYVGAAGEVSVPRKQLVGSLARKLVAGEKIPVTYLKSDPSQVMYPGDELPNPWGWLVVGVAAMGTFVYALRLRRRQDE